MLHVFRSRRRCIERKTRECDGRAGDNRSDKTIPKEVVAGFSAQPNGERTMNLEIILHEGYFCLTSRGYVHMNYKFRSSV
jgi:hypothetical protein